MLLELLLCTGTFLDTPFVLIVKALLIVPLYYLYFFSLYYLHLCCLCFLRFKNLTAYVFLLALLKSALVLFSLHALYLFILVLLLLDFDFEH